MIPNRFKLFTDELPSITLFRNTLITCGAAIAKIAFEKSPIPMTVTSLVKGFRYVFKYLP